MKATPGTAAATWASQLQPDGSAPVPEYMSVGIGLVMV
jgi:hypothetical protein